MNSAPIVGSWSRVVSSKRGKKSKTYHFSWVIDEVDSGFLVYKKKRQKYQMFRDYNQNGMLDNDDITISHGKISKDFFGANLTKILPKNIDGIITAKPHKSICNSKVVALHNPVNIIDAEQQTCEIATGINALGIEHLSLLNLNRATVIHDHGDSHNNHSI